MCRFNPLQREKMDLVGDGMKLYISNRIGIEKDVQNRLLFSFYCLSLLKKTLYEFIYIYTCIYLYFIYNIHISMLHNNR